MRASVSFDAWPTIHQCLYTLYIIHALHICMVTYSFLCSRYFFAVLNIFLMVFRAVCGCKIYDDHKKYDIINTYFRCRFTDVAVDDVSLSLLCGVWLVFGFIYCTFFHYLYLAHEIISLCESLLLCFKLSSLRLFCKLAIIHSFIIANVVLTKSICISDN